MTAFRSSVFAFVSILVVSLLSSCDHSTSVNSNTTIPRVGSIFNYVDSAWFLRSGFDTIIADSAIFPESDTVAASGTFFSMPNIIRFDSSARNLVSFTKNSTDSGTGGAVTQIKETYLNGAYYIAYVSSGDISMPALLTIKSYDSASVHRSDSGMQWLTFPVASHTTFQLVEVSDTLSHLGYVTMRDSIIAAPNTTIIVGGVAYDCEHAIDYHFYHTDSGFSDSPTKLDLYFSPELGVPVQVTLSVETSPNFWELLFTKRLVSFIN